MNITHEDGETVIENESRTVKMYWNTMGRFGVLVAESRSKPGSLGGDETEDFIDIEPQEMVAMATALVRESKAFRDEQMEIYKATKRGGK